MIKGLSRYKVIAIFLLAIISLVTVKTVLGFGTISVWTDRPVYYVGESIKISFDTMGGGIPATVIIDITGPVSISWGPTNIITGAIYTATLSGATLLPGYYMVRVTLGLEFDIYEGSTSYTVLPSEVVTEFTTITRTRSKTEVETLHTHTTKSLTRSSITTVTETEITMRKTISKTITLTELETETECSPTVITTVTITTDMVQQLSALSPLFAGILIVMELIHLRGFSSKKESE